MSNIQNGSEPSVSGTHVSHTDRRKFTRYGVTFSCEFSSDHCSGHGTVVDLSGGGCRIESDWHFYPGEYLCVHLNVPSAHRPVTSELAVVRWSAEQHFGVEFIRMDPTQQKRLALLVEYVHRDCLLSGL